MSTAASSLIAFSIVLCLTGSLIDFSAECAAVNIPYPMLYKRYERRRPAKTAQDESMVEIYEFFNTPHRPPSTLTDVELEEFLYCEVHPETRRCKQSTLDGRSHNQNRPKQPMRPLMPDWPKPWAQKPSGTNKDNQLPRRITTTAKTHIDTTTQSSYYAVFPPYTIATLKPFSTTTQRPLTTTTFRAPTTKSFRYPTTTTRTTITTTTTTTTPKTTTRIIKTIIPNPENQYPKSLNEDASTEFAPIPHFPIDDTYPDGNTDNGDDFDDDNQFGENGYNYDGKPLDYNETYDRNDGETFQEDNEIDEAEEKDTELDVDYENMVDEKTYDENDNENEKDNQISNDADALKKSSTTWSPFKFFG